MPQKYLFNPIGHTLKYRHFVFIDFQDFQDTAGSIVSAIAMDGQDQPTHSRKTQQHLEKQIAEIQQIYLAKGMYWSEVLMIFSDSIHQLLMETPQYYQSFMQYIQG